MSSGLKTLDMKMKKTSMVIFWIVWLDVLWSSQPFFGYIELSRDVRKPDFCICENKDADQLPGNREADQRLCFRYTDSTIPLLPKYKISSL